MVNPIAAQTAIVGNFFEFPVPFGAFISLNTPNSSYPLSYTLSQDSLPDWLHFNSHVPSFSGTPGRGDTNFYALHVLQIVLTASDGVANGSTVLTINVGGASWGEWAINIGAPVISILTTLYALYELRGLFLNRCHKKRYLKESKDYLPAGSCRVGEQVELRLKTPAREIEEVTVRLPAKRARSQCCQFFQLPPALPGNTPLPLWLEYDPLDNALRTKVPIPDLDEKYRQLVVQVAGEMGVILEQFTLTILPRRSASLAPLTSRKLDDGKELTGGDIEQGQNETVTFHQDQDVELQPLSLPTAQTTTLRPGTGTQGIRVRTPKDKVDEKDSSPRSSRLSPESPLRAKTPNHLLTSPSPTADTREEGKEIPLIQKKEKNHPRKNLSTRPLPLAPDSPLRTPTPPPASNSSVSSSSQSRQCRFC